MSETDNRYRVEAHIHLLSRGMGATPEYIEKIHTEEAERAYASRPIPKEPFAKILAMKERGEDAREEHEQEDSTWDEEGNKQALLSGSGAGAKFFKGKKTRVRLKV